MAEAASQDDIRRMEARLNELIVEVRKVVLIEERQLIQGQRLGDLEQRMKADEAVTQELYRIVNSWINRGIGIWVAVAAVYTLANAPTLIALIKR